ncbi:alpha/beta hydrolase fold domain-containing protein [Nonomuraea sp. NPDC059007]|uniref:alpha/beta hydrolase fold domain-containing protein n=1 Tax=Nonomuraea sp. NPDC059007 TaxID=3346692 RepID=UPI0036A6609F
MSDTLPLPPAPDAIELRHLRAFTAVADELNFGRAASRLYLSQPALSRQIRALERLIGYELLRRTTHRVELTPAGRALQERARVILADVDSAVAATRAAGDDTAGRIARLMDPRHAIVGSAHRQELREAFESLLAEFPVPTEIDTRPVSAGGVPSFVLTPGAERPPTVLYLHGGSYTMGSAYGYRSVVGAFCVAAGTSVLLPEYRLAPEHPYPAALDDILRAYQWLLDRTDDPGALAVAGDSSGGGLALSLLGVLKQRRLPMPGRAILLCPWVDLTCELMVKTASAPLLTLSRDAVRDYLQGRPASDPLLDPLAADLTGYPPMLVQVGTGDALVHEARLLAARAAEYGVEVELDLYPVDAHVFHMFWSFLPEAGQALSRAAAFHRGAAVQL